MKPFLILLATLAVVQSPSAAGELAFRTQEIDTSLKVGYAVSLVDVNEDGRDDIVVVDTQRVIWYENPTWQRHTIIEGVTKADNVCIAPYDIDGDGHVDFALGADWRPSDTQTGGTIQWLRRGKTLDEPWSVHAIGEEPTVHGMRWADLQGDGRPELLVVPLLGQGSTRPHFAERGVRVLAFRIPEKPQEQPWPMDVLNDELHVTHNFLPVEFDGDGRIDVLVTSFEGVNLLTRRDGRWTKRLLGTGNQETSPNRGASEIKLGRLGDGTKYIATIEPWHGHQVVVYTPPGSAGQGGGGALWQRHVLDEQLQWGHAIWCANLDDDADEELIIGVRDHRDEQHRSGVRIFDPQGATPGAWRRQLVDPAGVNVEDLAAGDLNGDGRWDIVAVGRQSHNVRIYWNE